MSDADKMGMFSNAGIISGQMYNIINSFQKINSFTKKHGFKNNYYPDKEFLDRLKGKNRLNPNEMINEINFNINELKRDINKNNIYLIEEENEKKKNKNKKKEIKNKNIQSPNQKDKIEILNKKQLFKSKKYKYHNEHMKRIEKYKTEGIYKNILGQKETSYNPNMEYIYKKILTGPKWETLSSRDLFNLNKQFKHFKQNNTINISSNNKKRNSNEKIKSKSRNRSSVIIPKKMKYTHSLSNKNNNTEIINHFFNNININNTNISTNNYYHSSLDNKYNNINNKIILSFDLKKNSLINNPNKLLIIKPNNILLNKIINKNDNININNPTPKKEYLPGPDFNRYLDLEKLARKKKRLQKIALSKITLMPNYSSIESNPKMFVNYNTKKNTLIKKPRIFKGINSYEFLYDAGKTFDKIYGNKMKAVPKFKKMAERPSDTNLPSFMKGLYSRLGLELEGEKSLKMNNFENSKMYKSQSFFGIKKNNYNMLRNICYEDDIDKEKDKIDRDLNIIKKKFKNIKYIEYD